MTGGNKEMANHDDFYAVCNFSAITNIEARGVSEVSIIRSFGYRTVNVVLLSIAELPSHTHPPILKAKTPVPNPNPELGWSPI